MLRQFAEEKNLPVTFLGFRQNHELPALLTAADFFVLPSCHEPWGVVVSEAMACGLPVLLSDRVGAAYDLLEDRRNGFLVPYASDEAWRNALQACAIEPQKLGAMGSRSREMVRGWTCQRATEQFSHLLAVALSPKRRAV
jgi:glycosyltransferase involved in cell wall biosynthesis